MIPTTRLGSGYALPNSLGSPSKARFSGSKPTSRTPEKIKKDLEWEKQVQVWKKEDAIRAAKKKRRADKNDRYGYVDKGLWQNFKNCYKAGYSSPLPIYRRPLAFLSVDNLKYGWQKLDKHLKKQNGRSEFMDVFMMAIEVFLAVITFGALPLFRMLFPRNKNSPNEKFFLAVQERAADKLRKK